MFQELESWTFSTDLADGTPTSKSDFWSSGWKAHADHLNPKNPAVPGWSVIVKMCIKCDSCIFRIYFTRNLYVITLSVGRELVKFQDPICCNVSKYSYIRPM